MSASSRTLWIRIHIFLASFFLPVGVMFAITGGLYTYGSKGSYETEKVSLPVDAPLTDDMDALLAMVREELGERGLDEPSGRPKVRHVGTSFQLEWSGSQLDLILAPTADPSLAEFTLKETGKHRFFVQLHKAKGGALFRGLAMALGAGLVLVFASGVVLAWQMPKLRPLSLIALAAGAASFCALAWLS